MKMDILVTKWIALEGTAQIAEAETENLLKRFPSWLVCEAKSFTSYLSTDTEEKVCHELGIKTILKVGNNGIFGALWDLAEEHKTGLRVELKKIPVRQETIEIYNYIDQNPYESASGGMLLIFCDKSDELLSHLEVAGVLSTIIGQTTNNNDRVILNKDRVRFLKALNE